MMNAAIDQPNHGKAIVFHGLMLLNLLFPVVIYLGLTVLWVKNHKTSDPAMYAAVNQAWVAASISTTLFILGHVMILTWAQYKSTFALITFEVYFVFVVPIFLIPGLLGLVKSNAGLIYHYPILGHFFSLEKR